MYRKQKTYIKEKKKLILLENIYKMTVKIHLANSDCKWFREPKSTEIATKATASPTCIQPLPSGIVM